MRRDFLHIDDLTDFHMAAFEHRKNAKGTETYNAGYGVNWSISDIHRFVYKACSNISDTVPSDIEYRPAQPDEAQITLADITKAREDFGWTPKISIEDGIKRTIDELWEKKMCL